MLNYLLSFIYGEDEVKVDVKSLRQKYLLLLQIKDNKIRLKPIIEKKKPMKVMCSYKKKVLP